MILQRYTFGSKSQPGGEGNTEAQGCLWYCKDIHLEANHNYYQPFQDRIQLLMILQRYTFGSKSQRSDSYNTRSWCCLWYCKDIHLEANHNRAWPVYLWRCVAYDIAKIYIWKQITTDLVSYLMIQKLLMILQRYTFGSKSQHHLFG